MKKCAKKDSGGFTLLEVILSIAILGLISAPLMKYFTDSLRHTALTARKQKATMLAQETIESLKARDRLIERVLGGAGGSSLYYWVPSIAGEDENATDGEYTTEDCTGFDKDNGTTAAGSPLKLIKTVTRGGLDFDVVVSLSTDVDANDVARPVVYGIDDTRTAMIVERDEEQEALLYFLARNTSYVANHGGIPGGATPTPAPGGETPDPGGATPSPAPGGATPAPGGATPTPAPVTLFGSLDNVRKLLEREIFIEIGKEADPGGYFTVKAYYKYYCTKVTNEARTEYPSGHNLLDTRVEKLESVYLLFNIVDPDKDIIHVKWDILDNSGIKAPALALVCQNLDQLKTADDPGATPAPAGTPAPGDPDEPFAFTAQEYHLTLDVNNAVQGAWPEGNDPVIRTNIVSETADKNKGTIKRPDGTEFLTIVELTQDGTAVRILDLDVQIYAAGDYAAGKEPLAEMKTTKGE